MKQQEEYLRWVITGQKAFPLYRGGLAGGRMFGFEVTLSGAGLEPTITKRMVERHGSNISVENTLAEGGAINFSIPLTQKEGKDQGVAGSPGNLIRR